MTPVDHAPTASLHDEAASVLDWWRAAGVHTVIDETPRSWLTAAAPAIAVSAARAAQLHTSPSVTDPVLDAPLPDTLPMFVEWLLTDTSTLRDYPARRRLPPHGDPASGLMIVTDFPEAGDDAAVQLLTGEVGALFDRMLAALGRDRGSIYLATVAPARPATGMLDAASVKVLSPALMRHIELVQPRKLWLMGTAASTAVLGMPESIAAGRSHSVNQNGATIDAIATVHPRVLLRQPKAKAAVWSDMMRLMEMETA